MNFNQKMAPAVSRFTAACITPEYRECYKMSHLELNNELYYYKIDIVIKENSVYS